MEKVRAARTSATAGASSRLLALREAVSARGDETCLGDIIDGLGQAGLGLVLLVLTLPSLIPLPGPFGLAFGTLIAFVSLQVLAGARRLWLPVSLRRRRIPPAVVHAIVDKGVPWLQRVEGFLRPRRMLPLTGRAARIWLAVPLFVLAVTLALPIPFGNVAPAASLIAFGLGFMQRDGLAVIVGLGLTAFTLAWTALLVLFGAAILEWAFGLVALA